MAYSYGSQINKNYISSTAFLDQREILNKVLDITNEESSFLDVMELTGRSVVTSVPTYHHFVNQELYQVITASAAVAAGSAAGAPTTIPLSASDASYVNAGDLLLLGDGSVVYVTSRNLTTAGVATSVSIKSIDSQTIASAASGTKYAVFSNAAGEGSLSPDARKWNVIKHLNQVQTFKSKFQITDIQKASKVEVDFNGKPFYMYKGQHESLVKFRGDISNALLFGRISATAAPTAGTYPAGNGFAEGGSAVLTDAEGNPVQTTMGLNQYTELYGFNQNNVTATYGLADLKALTQQLNKVRAPQEYFLFCGTEMNIQFDNLLNNLGNSALLSQGARFQIAGKELDLGIDKAKIYGRTYYKKYLPILDHQNIILSGNTHKFDRTAFGVPATKQKTVDGQVLDRIQVRYMAGDGTDLKYREILLGGLAPVPTNERSVLEIHYQSTQGLQVLGANHLFKIQGISA